MDSDEEGGEDAVEKGEDARGSVACGVGGRPSSGEDG